MSEPDAHGWLLIEDAPFELGWLKPSLLGKWRKWGFEIWVGQCDDGDYWLARDGDGDCYLTDKPTHWQPLPLPPTPPAFGDGQAPL